jgi:thiol-disulfide isomerase/thioredoxin
MVFTYSTFYELPWVLPMQKKGNDWVASFKLQRYATYATFYFQSGDLMDKPAADRHYAIAVYDGKNRVKSSYLHESYSLGTQMGAKSASLPARVQETLKKELAVYPNNYEAKIRLLNHKISQAKTPEEKLKFRNEARRIIAAKLEEAPTVMGNINLVTMGYLIIGENTRLDSVRQVIAKRYPHSSVAKEFIIAKATKGRDTATRIAVLENALKDEGNADDEEFADIHAQLFGLYAARHEEKKALQHLPRLMKEKSPYTPQTLKNTAEILTSAQMAQDTAIAYINRALKVVDQYPVGIIRFFPEFGHIPSFVADSTRAKKVKDEKADLYALMALNKLYQKDNVSAVAYADRARGLSGIPEVLHKAAIVYTQAGKPKEAYETSCDILLQDPTDTVAFKAARLNSLQLNIGDAAFKEKIKELNAAYRTKISEAMRRKLLNKAQPELNGIVTLTGKAVNMNDLRGKVVVMDFWATWCVPCMEELPYLQKVYEQYKDQPNVVFMVINSGARNTIDDARGWAKKNTQYTFPLYFNNDTAIGEKVGFTVIPTVALLDQQGKMQFRTIGFEGAEMENKLTAQIEILLNSGK